MRLSELIGGDGSGETPAPEGLAADPEILGLAADSRQVGPGFLYAALPGSRANGIDFVPEALGRGAVAVLAPPGARLDGAAPGIALIADGNPRRRLALMAARFYGQQPETIAAVTGTNGKTSVAAFTRQIWTQLGFAAASLGTLGVHEPRGVRPAPLTTPDPVALHMELAQLAARGVDHLALEASSHGLDQHRLDGVRVSVAAFTNLSRDHLDYHGDMDRYRRAKMRLFGELMPEGGVAVLNADSPEWAAFRDLSAARGHRIMGYGRAARAGDIRLDAAAARPDSLHLDLTVRDRGLRLELPLVGVFQAMNALCALGLVLACGGEAQAAAAALTRLDGAPGRLQRVARHPNGAVIYVDYAHTPDALESALSALRPHVERRLAVVFGCGGDRDPGKRPLMGEIAARLADRVIVTDDNPRSEAPATIRREILEACPGAEEADDRADAIETAIRDLEPGDLLVIAGKGHEREQIIGDEVRPFDDAEVARERLAALGESP